MTSFFHSLILNKFDIFPLAVGSVRQNGNNNVGFKIMVVPASAYARVCSILDYVKPVIYLG